MWTFCFSLTLFPMSSASHACTRACILLPLANARESRVPSSSTCLHLVNPQSIKSRSQVGAANEMSAEMQSKYAGFGTIDPRIRLDFEELGLTLPGKGRVLQGVSGALGVKQMFLCLSLSLS